jgi:DnaJ domain
VPDRAWRDLGDNDAYAILGVTRDASREDVLRAYRRRVRRVHPDVPGGSEEETKRLHLARDILLDPIARAQYDSRTKEPEPAEPLPEPDLPGAWDTRDIVAGAGPAPSQPASVRPPAAEPPLVGEVVTEPFSPAAGAYPYPPPSQPYLFYPSPAPARESQVLAVIALVMAIVVAPLGLVVALVALARSRRGGAARRICIVAVAIAAGELACCIVWSGLAEIAQSSSSPP